MIRLLIVDDEYYIRLGIKNAIDWKSIGIEIVGEAEDGEQGLAMALELEPDLLLMDIHMPFLDGLELLEEIAARHLDCGVIVLSGYDEFEYAQRAIKYGVLDYLLKPIDKNKLKETAMNAGIAIRKRRSVQHYQQLVNKEQTAIRAQFLRDFICGTITDETFADSRIQELHLPLSDGPFQVICVKLDDYSLLERQLPPEELADLRDCVFTCLSNFFLLSKSSMGMITDISLEEWAVILTHLNTATSLEKEAELRSNMSDFFKAIEERTSHTVSVSISRLCELVTDLPAICLEARLANKKYLPCANSTTWADKEEGGSIRAEVQEALRFIKEHYREEITIQQIADALYLSPYYLMHIFKSDIGKTFNTFLTDFRMETAKELLQIPGCKIYEIARQVGYSDVKYFNKLFKKHTGLTPSDFIRIHYAKN